MEEQEEENYEVPETPYQIPRDQAGGSNILYLTNPTEELRQAELLFRGLDEDSEGNIKKYGEPLMNNEGIKVIIGLMRSVASQITIMGTQNENDIRVIMLDYMNELNKVLLMKRVSFGLSRGNRPIIKTVAKYMPLFALKRALNGGERKFWGTVQHDIKQVIERPRNQGQGSGMLGRFLRR